MEKVSIESVPNDPHEMGVNEIRRNVGTALGTEYIAFVYYELAPGDQFSGGVHTHHDQEEVFYIIDGRVTFEYTRDGEEVIVDAGDVIRFGPGEFQCGRNQSEQRVIAVALGAPVPASSAEETEWITHCDTCATATLHGVRSHDGGAIVSYCETCGTEFSS
jgi:uncharacterized cupin superfamily protein